MKKGLAALVVAGLAAVASTQTVCVSCGGSGGTPDPPPVTLNVSIASDQGTVAIDEDVTFTPTVSLGTGPYTYQWQFEEDPLWDNLVNYWRLDETGAATTRRDSKRFSHLAAAGGPGSVVGVGGRNATTFAKTGNGDEATGHILSRVPQADIDGSNGITLTYFVYLPTGLPVGNVWFRNGATFISQIATGDANSLPQAHFCTLNNDPNTVATSVGIYPLTLDTWHFIVCAYDPATKKAKISDNNGAFTLAADALVGPHPDINNGYGQGVVYVGGDTRHAFYSTSRMQDVALFNTMLSGAQITELYNSGNGKVFPGSTLEAPVWAYAAAGAKTISLLVTDSLGNTGTDTAVVTVEP